MSKISFCNFPLARELFKRNWYVAGLYLMGWLLILVPTLSRIRYIPYLSSRVESTSLIHQLPLFLTFSAFLTLVYCIVAVCVKCDFLFKSESACFHGALAMKRSTLLFTSFVALVIPGVIVNVLVGSLVNIAELAIEFDQHIGTTLAVSGYLMVIINGGFCLFAASLSNSRLIFIILTLMLHGCAFALDFGLKSAKLLFSYGIPSVFDFSTQAMILSPMVKLEESFFMGAHWTWLGTYTVVALAAVIGACLLFTYRPLETTGEGIAFKKLRLPFSFAFSLAFGLGFALFGYTLLDGIGDPTQPAISLGAMGKFMVFYLIGALGSFTVLESIMAKSTGIIKSRLSSLVLLAVFCSAVSIGCYEMGKHETFAIPDTVDISSVSVNGIELVATTPEALDTSVDLHASIIQAYKTAVAEGSVDLTLNNSSDQGKEASNPFLDDSYTTSIAFTYHLKDGQTVLRRYPITLTREGIVDPDSYMGKIAYLASSPLSRQSRVDLLYEHARSYPDDNAADIVFTSQTESEIDAKDMTLTISGKKLKSLLDDGLAAEMLSSAASDPDLIRWVNRDQEDESIVAYVMLSGYRFTEGFYLSASVEISAQSTPKALSWIRRQYDAVANPALEESGV